MGGDENAKSESDEGDDAAGDVQPSEEDEKTEWDFVDQDDITLDAMDLLGGDS